MKRRNHYEFDCCGFKVSDHAFLRFMERWPTTFQSDNDAFETFIYVFESAVPFDFNDHTRLWKSGEWIFAIDEEDSIIKTCYVDE